MTKKEKIQEAYGRFYDKRFIRNDGSMSEKIWKHMEIDLEYDDYSTGYFRPKSLQGIENNNGWIKIESEGDLPKESGDFYVIHERSINYYPMAEKQLFKKWIGVYTHYQPIVKPQQPIY